MALLTLKDVCLAYGHVPLLERVALQIDAGERICLVGRNGAGKSTLLRVISGRVEPDEGEVWRRDTLRVSHLEQEVPADAPGTVYQVVAAGLGHLGELLHAYHDAAQHAAHAGDAALARLAELQQRIDVAGGFGIEQRVETVLSRLSLPADVPMARCSGGIRRRVMLAQALVSGPDVLLLDEPTNHMDIAAITWLEEFLLGFNGAVVFVTHDRTLLSHLATRIVELDRGALRSFPGDFAHYLRRKEALQEAEERAAARFDRKLAQEEAWIRQGIRARRTRNEGRVRALQDMRRERARRIERQGQARLDVDDGAASGKVVVDLNDVGFGYDERPVIQGLTTRVLRGDRVGIIGPNGCGKSTLLRLMLGELEPDTGRILVGTRLEIAYFDQHRGRLDPEKTVRENVAGGGDRVTVRGRSRHVVGYLKSFLFPPERIDSPVKALSGGERNRLLLAKIFTRPANVLVLDEPTNDLDIDTLELLEDMLADYDGTLLLVSHDRAFLDNVVTSVLAFEESGRVGEYVGGYEDWLRQRPPSRVPAAGSVAGSRPAAPPPKATARPRRLSYKEKRELEALPELLERLEGEQHELEARVNDGAFYRQDRDAITAALRELERVGAELERAYARWEYLESADR